MVARAWLLALLFTVVAAVLMGRLFQLQVLHGDRYAEDVVQSRLAVDYQGARRGRILDRHGTPLVDNRAVYDAAVVLARLEHGRADRRRIDFWRLDRSRYDDLLSEFSARTFIPPLELRRELDALLEDFPAVAIRQGEAVVDAEGDAGLVVLPQAAFLDAANALGGLDADAEAAPIDPRLARLAESGLLFDDPRAALTREFDRRRGNGTLVLTHRELDALIDELAVAWSVPPQMLAAVLEPFAPVVRLRDSDGGPDAGEGGASAADSRRWRILVAERRRQAEAAIARFLSASRDTVREALRAAVRRVRAPSDPGPWYYVSAVDRGALGELLPDAIETRLLRLDGAPPSRERVWLLQGDAPETEGMFTLLCHRLAPALGLPPDEIAFILTRHAERVGIRQMERRYRVHLITFDRARLERLTTDLAAVFANTAVDATLSRIEAAIADARRTADREWRGSTRHDPLVIVPDLPQQVAVDLAGAGAELPPRDPLVRGFLGTGPDLPGLRIVARMGREYPFPGTASHVLGWLGRLSARVDRRDALALGLDPQGWAGARGIEARYDEVLQGILGRRVRLRTATGWQLLEHECRAPVPGTDLATTLDIELQLAVEDALGRWLQLADDLGTIPPAHRDEVLAAQAINRGRAGMCVIDVDTGAVRALASTPGFRLSEIRTRYRELIDPEASPGQPLHDNATWAAQPPGSTLKPLVALAAMAEGVLGPTEVVHTQGYMARWRGRGVLGDHPPVPHDWRVEEAITRSSNTFFATVAERLGPRKLVAWLHRFGLGERNAVDIDWQRPGLVPDPDNIMRTRPSEPTWLPADTWRLGIGQFCTASPLQIAPLAAAVANGGTILRPYLWRGQADHAVAEHIDLPAHALQAVRDGMIAVTERGGTAPWLQLGGVVGDIQVAAKTGTSEWGSRDSRRAGLTPDNGWLMGYAPADDPQVAFAIYVHAAGMSGGRACSGIAVQVLQTYFTQQLRAAGAAGR